MYKCMKSLVIFIWLLDIFNVNISNISWLVWLEPILNDSNCFNFWFWLITLSILPSTDLSVKLNKED